MTEMDQLAHEVKAARRRLGMTQQDLADAAGLYVGTLSNFERRKTDLHPHHLRAVLKVLGLEKDAGDGQASKTRTEWDADVKTFLDMMGLFLMALPEDERRTLMFDMTRQVVNR